jgi:cobalt-zinc-cadmium efflux system membrane fusion protein
MFTTRRVGPWLLAVVLGIGVAVGAGLASWGNATGDETAPTEERAGEHALELPAGIVEVPEAAQRNAGLQVMTPEKRVMPATIEVTGAVAADESKVVHIRPLARGVIESIAVSLGARVTRGQALLTYDNIELGGLIGEYLSQRAVLLQTQTDQDVRRLALERAQELIKLEAIAQQTVEARRADFKNAEAAVASQRAHVAKIEEQIHRFGLTDIDLKALTPDEDRNSHRTASHSVLRAPISGVVTKYDVAAGELVEPERELFTISDLSVVWVLADVYEKDLAKVRPNTDVNIRLDAYPDRTFVGRLTYISDLIDPRTRTAKVRCVVPNPDAAIKLDMFAKVDVPTTDSREAVSVPVAAVQHIDNQPVVFVQQSAARFARRDVQLGITVRDQIEIVSGLKPGETIAGAGSFYLKTALLRERIGEEH